MEFLQDIEAGLTGDMHIKQHAGWRSRPCNRQQGRAVGETDDLVATGRQHHRKRIANSGVVVDYKNLPAGGGFISHVPSSMRG